MILLNDLRRWAPLVVAAAFAGCNPQAPATSATPTAGSLGPSGSTTPLPTPTPSLAPIHVTTQSSGTKEATFVQEAHNRKVYVVKARSSVADRRPDGTFDVKLVKPRITFYDKTGKVLKGTAPTADVAQSGKLVTMRGGVRTVSQDGGVLTCDTMTYAQATDMIHGEGHVVLVNANGDKLTGQSIDADMRFDHVTVNGSP